MSIIYNPSSIPLRIPFSYYRSYNYIKPIRIIGLDTKLTDYQVKIDLDSSNFPFEKCRADGYDICFIDTDGQLLDYWLESWSKANRIGKVWCKIPEIESRTDKLIWLIYGKSDGESTSNGTNTFEFFDGFEDGTYEGETGVVSNFGDYQRNRASYIVGNYAYIVYETGLRIVDITNPNSPVLKGYVALGTDQCIDVVGDSSYAYVSNYGDNKLFVVDVSDVDSPSEAGSVADATKLKGIHGLYKLGDYIYCCGYSAGTDGHFTIVDVSTPNTPTIRGTIANDANNYIKGSHDVAVIGNYAYMIGSNHHVDDDGRFTILNISDKDSISVVKSITGSEFHRSADIQIKGIYAFFGQWGYPAAAPANRYFRVIDISDVNDPFIAGGLAGYNMYIGYIHGNLIYCADNRYNYITVIDISTPTSPSFVKQYIIPGNTAVLHVFLTTDGNHAVVARYNDATNDKFYIIDTLATLTTNWVIAESETGDTVSATTKKLVMEKGGTDGYLSLTSEIPFLLSSKRFWEFFVEYPTNERCNLVINGDNANPSAGGIYLAFDTNGVRYYEGGYHTICAMDADTEYKISIVPDVSTNTFDIYVYKDDIEVSYSGAHIGLSFRNNATYLNQWRPNIWSANIDKGVYDNFLIRKYNSLEPQVIVL